MADLQEPTGTRAWRERAVQALTYEVGGALLITPLFAHTIDHGIAESALLMITIILVCPVWTFAHNLVFDFTEQRCGGGPASDRPHWLRMFHAFSLEVTSIIVTLPLIIYIGGFSFWEAVAIDLALSVAYTFYAYLFFLIFDRLFPVHTSKLSAFN